MQCPVCAAQANSLTPATAQKSARGGCSALYLVTCILALGCCAPGQASARTFGGYDCTDNCVGHAAGYRWAEERGLENMDECPENRSEAFYEGCLAYVDDLSTADWTTRVYRSWSRDGLPIRGNRRDPMRSHREPHRKRGGSRRRLGKPKSESGQQRRSAAVLGRASTQMEKHAKHALLGAATRVAI